MNHTPLTIRIRRQLPDLQPAMRRVGEVVIADPVAASSLPITALAKQAETSETTVIRFCRELGLSGYPQLRLALARESSPGRDELDPVAMGDILRDDDLESVVRKISYADITSVRDTADSLSLAELESVVKDAAKAKRIEIYGVGASAIVAEDFQIKLHRIGIPASSYADPHRAAVSAALADKDTMVFAFSHSGRVRDTYLPLEVAKAGGAKTVAITNAPKSPIAQIADRVLLTAATETTFRAGATSSRLAQLTVVDCLFVALAQQTFDKSIEALQTTREVAAIMFDTKGSP